MFFSVGIQVKLRRRFYLHSYLLNVYKVLRFVTSGNCK